jgi:ABC-2 type transport system permease protein
MTQTLSRNETQAAPRAANSSLGYVISDCTALIGRNVKHIVRNPEMLFQAVSLPIILLLLFRFMFGGAINVGALSYVDYVVPGLIVISVAFNSTTTVVGVCGDLSNGLVDRFRSMPMFGPAVLVGHVAANLLRNALSTVVMVGVGLLVGFRPGGGFLDWLGAMGMLALFATGIAWLAVLLGTVASTVEGASGLGMILVFVPYASSALVPTETMPSVLGAIVDNQPVTVMIDAIRALMNGMPLGNAGWLAAIWWVAIVAVAVPLAIRGFHRRATG